MQELRIGCVPYLNAKPLIDWFHSPDCDIPAEVHYVVPSRLPAMLADGMIDVALVSIFERFRSPDLTLIPDISISADGPVKSVRLFSCSPFEHVRSVALDTSSLTSVALTRILLKERYGITPEYVSHPPDLDAMLTRCDAGLIIGDLKLFDTPATHILDLGEAWKDLTGLPFVYAAWLARSDAPIGAVTAALTRARDSGMARLDSLSTRWAAELQLPLDRVQDYFYNVMEYNLDTPKQRGMEMFETKCREHGLT
jgi:chorismate dehydratase